MSQETGKREAAGSGLWGGRVSAGPAPALDRLNRSLPFDYRLWPHEIEIDRAWVEELVRIGVLEQDDGRLLLSGLDAVQQRLERENPASEWDEDIHSLIERWLEEEVGPLASQVRLGRSRNDVVATGGRMWARQAASNVDEGIAGLQQALVEVAERSGEAPFPLYSHMQPAQPTRAANWLLAHFWALDRNRKRIADCRDRLNEMPLGAAAGAGTGVPVDRDRLATVLKFSRPSRNSLDAVSARDWTAELVWTLAMTANDLSRLAEDLVFYSSSEFGLLRFSDEWTTGSSLMPQKRNPDGAELARATGGVLLGQLTGLLATLKGLPSGYQKDLQEDKRTLFASQERIAEVLEVLAGSVESMEVVPSRAAECLDPSVLASDLAERLALEGMPFRAAHETVGRLVRRAEQMGVPLSRLEAREVEATAPSLVEAWSQMFDSNAALERRSASGGSSTRAVREQIREARAAL